MEKIKSPTSRKRCEKWGNERWKRSSHLIKYLDGEDATLYFDSGVGIDLNLDRPASRPRQNRRVNSLIADRANRVRR
jgi:hypothetical protein